MIQKNIKWCNYLKKNISLKCFLFFIFILFILIIGYNKYNNIETFLNNKNYYRCDKKKLGTITNNIFNDYGINKDNKNWDIYVPCGYNFVEHELLTINKNNMNNNNNTKYVFGINGCDSIVSKNKIWESLVDCYGRKEAARYMPESYVLHKTNDMELFKNQFNSKTIYILKKNVQRKEGLKLTSNLHVIMTSVLDDYRVVQRYLTNLYLINKRKVNLRIYLLVVVRNGYKMFYTSKIGKCIYTKKEYNDNNFDFESNITSYNLDMTIYKTNPRSLTELYQFVKKDSKNNSNLLENNINILMAKVSKCLSNNIFQSSNIKNTVCFQLFGGDVIFDNNLNAYLLEFNKGPDMIPRDKDDSLMKHTVQQDMFKTIGLVPQRNNNVFSEVYRSKL